MENQTNLTPKNKPKYFKHMVRSTISLSSSRSMNSDKRQYLLEGLDFSKIDEN